MVISILLRGCACSTLKYMKAAMPAFSRECACSTLKYTKAAMLVYSHVVFIQTAERWS